MLFLGLIVGATVAWLWVSAAMKRRLQVEEDRAAGLNRELTTIKHENREVCSNVTQQAREIQNHRDLAVLLPELVKQIFSARSVNELADFVARAVSMMTNTEKVAVFLSDRTGRRLGLVEARGLSDVLQMPLALNVGEGHVGFSAETGRVFSIEDLEKESTLVRKHIEDSAIPGYAPELAAPMTSQGVLYGVLCLNGIPKGSNLVRERVRAIAAIGAAASENIRLLERFETAADLDPDTALPGKSQMRHRMDSELERVRRFNSPLSIIELQLPQGASTDRLLAKEVMRMCANQLKATMRNIDTGVRVARDRVMLLLPGTNAEGLVSVVARLGVDLPGMTNEEGDRIASVRMRFLTCEPGEDLSVDPVLQRLDLMEFREFSS
jgi:GGDEF domain-containing protein